MRTIPGIHHVTAIAGPAQENLDFYAGLLGLRFVKKTVNFDDPGTYHFYYGNGTGQPGSILTFFPWANAFPGKNGTGFATATAFSVPASALDFWMERFADAAYDFDAPIERFGEQVLALNDPHGLPIELVADAREDSAEPWAHGPVPAEAAIRAFHGVTLSMRQADRSIPLIAEVFGYEALAEDGDRIRFRASGAGAPAAYVDVLRLPNGLPGRQGTGTVHHVAFRAKDDDELEFWRGHLSNLGLRVTTIIDRQYFHSIYFREPNGILYEIATDPPGFTADEPQETLGHALKLPAQYEHRRAELERVLPAVQIPS